MDKPTRNLIQKATQDARHLLETEFSRQLEGVFDILPDGTVAPEPGEHLDPAQKVIRRKIVAAIEHEKASGMSDREAVAAYLREASFTCLNRFTALKMLEARGLTLECVSRGEQSSGFKEFCGLAPGLSELPDRVYRLYIESLFDELSTEVRVLFDRRHPASLLWPGRKALEGLLAVLNREEIREIWGEDETIGWVYQYFNSVEERKKMREESAAPRNSRELAVRNQFFTPRYVVEFLTDNTLGRIWYEMRQGMTDLKESCRYLVRRPDEVFLSEFTADDRNLAEMGRLLQEGDEATFPAFSGPEDADRMIQLAHCVDGYLRHPFEDQVGDTWWPWWRKQRIVDGEPLEEVSTQDLMDILFAEVRADRHGGDGEMFEDPLTLKMANEVRRRVMARRDDLSQEELLRLPAFVPFRAKKDPRDIRVLDPACGSGHFLLYAFDLLERIYEEAWADGGSPFSEATGRSLRKDYETVEELRAAIPKMIIEHNLHGIDIDPRAVQIAVLAIWLRAQKAWKGFGVKAGDRPRVVKSNIVTAEPMPGEEGMRREFIEGLQPKVLGQLAEIVFEKMELAGEAGSLLKIEEEIREAIDEARKQLLDKKIFVKHARRLPGQEHRQLQFGGDDDQPDISKHGIRFDFEGATTEEFWEHIEERILAALKSYSERSENGNLVKRRLFSEDTARGFAFIDLCRKNYEAIIMNPPFGDYTRRSQRYIHQTYQKSKNDIYGCFIDLAIQRRKTFGLIGAITSRTWMFLPRRKSIRVEIVMAKAQVFCLADLGHGVLDGAMVETCAFILGPYSPRNPNIFMRLTDQTLEVKPTALRETLALASHPLRYEINQDRFNLLPNSPFAYWISKPLFDLISKKERFDENWEISPGLTTRDNDRFLRSKLEVPRESLGRKWHWFAKGGSYSPYYFDTELVLNYEEDGHEVKNWIQMLKESVTTFIANQRLYFQCGLSYPRVTDKGFNVRVLPKNHIFAEKGISIFKKNDSESMLSALAFLNTDLVQELLLLMAPSRSWEKSFVACLPNPDYDAQFLEEKANIILQILLKTISCDLTSNLFIRLPIGVSLTSCFTEFEKRQNEHETEINQTQELIDQHVRKKASCPIVSKNDFRARPWEAAYIFPDIIAYILSIIEYVTGCFVGRWDVRLAIDNSYFPNLPNPFDALPVCPPAMLLSPNGFPASSDQIVSEQWLLSRPNTNSLPADGIVKKATIFDSEYPLRINWNGIIVDDPGFEGQQLHDDDIILRTREVLEVLWKEKAQDIEQEACDILKIPDLRTYFRKSFFKDHISRYSKSRRKAPIYWQLATPSASYAVWLYYHRFTKDTFYNVLNDYVAPKLQFEERQLTNIRQQYGTSPTATQRKEIAARESFVEELTNFKDEVARVAPLWNPNLNDGVIINFAPLWRLVPQNKPWQKECKKVWDKLVKGDYDWAHLAMHLWPERVVPKCKKDRSLAIAHGLDDAFWEEDDKGKPKPKKVSKDAIDALVQERTSPTVKAALDDLLKAPTPANPTGKKRKKRA